MNAFEIAVLFAIPVFLLLMLAEIVYGKLKGPDNWVHQADAISSISSGLTYLAMRTLGFGVLVISYDWVVANTPVSEMLPAGIGLFVLVFVWKDFTGYWIHRWAHANSFLWATHMIHHSSEEFNLAVALRQNAFDWISYGGLMFLPLALLGVSTETVAVVAPLHFFMQFWYHTQHVGKLGWLEYIIVTPSQHRVHHAINPRYIDRNFGQIFCWDRLFGSFQEELESDPPAYGITTPVRHYNPVMIELNYMGRLLRDACVTRSWRDKGGVFLSRTGWRPADVAERWPAGKRDYRDPGQKFRVEHSHWQIIWGWFHFVVTLLLATYALANAEAFDAVVKSALLLVVLTGIFANSQQLMRQATLGVEALRLGLVGWLSLAGVAVFGYWGPWLLPLLVTSCAVSVVVSLVTRRADTEVSAFNDMPL